MTEIEIAQETFAYYKDGKNLALNIITGNCEYCTEDGHKCAVGRALDPDLVKNELGFDIQQISEILDQQGGSGVQSLNDFCENGLDSILKAEYRGHDITFWSDMQHWHDNMAIGVESITIMNKYKSPE